MRTLSALLVAVVAVGCAFGATFPGSRFPESHKPAPHGPTYQSTISPKILQNIYDFGKVIHGKIDAFNKEIDSFSDQSTSLLDSYYYLISPKYYELKDKAEEQDEYLEYIRNKIKDLLHGVNDAEARVAAGLAMAQEQLANLDRVSIDSLVKINAQQDAKLDKLHVELYDDVEKVHDKLTQGNTRAQDKVNELYTNFNAAVKFLNHRLCASETVYVKINNKTNTGHAEIDLPTGKVDFNGQTPNVMCALQGLNSYLNLYPEESSYGYDPETSNLGLSVTCDASDYKINVYVTDLSRGPGNGVGDVYVQVKACTLGAVDGERFKGHDDE